MSYVHTLEITTVSRCSINCTYCPQDRLRAAYTGAHRLSFDHFCRCIESVPRDVRIHFSGFVEPWLNEACTAMLARALGTGHRVAIYTTLQGMKNADGVTYLLRKHQAQVDVICIHLPDTAGNMRGFEDSVEYSLSVECFRGLERTTKLPIEWMTMGATETHASRLNAWEPNDRAGSLGLVQLGGRSTPPRTQALGPIACSYTDTYTHNVMLPNGDVVLCCNDYNLRHRLGNLLTQSWEEIVNGPEMQRIKAENAKADGETICRKCNGAMPCAS